MRSLYTFLSQKAKWPHIAALYLAQNALFYLMTLIILPVAEQNLGGLRVPDMTKQGYDSHYIALLISSMSESSKATYLRVQMPLDFLYPLVMASVFLVIFAKVWPKCRHIGCALPLLLVLFDWAENICVILMFINPGSVGLAPLSSFFTRAKMIVGDYVLFYLALISLGVAVVRRIRPKAGLR